MAMHKALFAAVLRNLGHDVPTEAELDRALKASFAEIKADEGLNAEAVAYKLTLAPVDRKWVVETFSEA